MTYRFQRAVHKGEIFENISDVFLYGSRSMADDLCRDGKRESLCKDSDWDYAVQYTEAAREELSMKGWKEVDVESYQDASTEIVFEKDFEGDKIQISLRHNLRAFKDLWLSIPQDFYWKRLNKNSPDCLEREEIQAYMSQLFYLVSGLYTPKINGGAIRVPVEEGRNVYDIPPAPRLNRLEGAFRFQDLILAENEVARW